jgi:hypothetical protein
MLSLRHVVIELKTAKLLPEHAGQLGLYVAPGRRPTPPQLPSTIGAQAPNESVSCDILAPAIDEPAGGADTRR